MHLSIIVLLLSLTTTALVNAQIDPYCNIDDYATDSDDLQLPDLPDQFYYSLEATLVERNRSFFAQEYFDEIGNRGRVDFTSSFGKSSAISDYNLGEAFVFPNSRTGEECSVSLLSNNMSFSRVTQFFFGIVHGENNTVHIGAPSFMFYGSINMSNVNYIGINVSRGIPSHHWQTCVVMENNSYTLDYYFTNSDLWSNSYGVDGYIPVTVELRGTRLNMTSGEIINVEHYYSFVDFNTGSGSVSDEVFMVPTGLICSGRIPGLKVPSLPDYYSSGIEIISENTVTYFQEYYDLTHSLFRIDGYISIPDYYTGIFTTIHDFNSETQYFFTSNDSSRACTTSPLLYEYASFDADVDSEGHLHLQTLKSLLFAEDFRDYVYEGVAASEVEAGVDVWIAQNLSSITIMNKTYTNNRYQLYFTRPGVEIDSIYGTTSEPTLWATSYTGIETTTYPNGTTSSSNISSFSSYFAFSSTEPSIDVFDISECLSSGEYAELRMSINATTANLNQVNLKQNIRAAIVDYAKSIQMPFLSPLQVSSIRVGSNEEFTHVHVHIANISSMAVTKWDYSANDIVNRMVRDVKDGEQLPFSIRIGDSTVTPYYRSEESEEEEESEGLSNAAVAGISIGTFVFGMIVGAITVVLVHLFCSMCFKKKKGSVNFQSSKHEKYERQIDDIPIGDN